MKSSSASAGESGRRRRRSYASQAIGLGLVFCASILPLATVGPGWRSVLAVVAAGVAAWVLLSTRSRALGPLSQATAALAMGAVGLSVLVMVPVSAELRSALQPGLSQPVAAALEVAGGGRAPLALDPWRGLLEWGLTVAMILLLIATSTVARDSRSAARLARTCVGGGVFLVVIALLHAATGADQIWWVSGAPSFSREPFFGTFVNPNHGGIACAALAPLALVLVVRDKSVWRAAAGAALAMLSLGVAWSGSRGALLSAGVGAVIVVTVLGGRTGRRVLGVALVTGVLSVLVMGVEDSLRRLSEWLVPTALVDGQDVLTGRTEIYGDAVEVVAAAPWVGVGSHGFDDGYRVLKSTPTFTDPVHAHLEPLQIVAEHGGVIALIWAAVVLLAFLVPLLRSAAVERSRRRLMLAGWLGCAAALGIACLFTFPLRIGALQCLLVIAAGASIGLADESDVGAARLPAWGVGVALVVIAVQASVWGLRDVEGSRFGDADLAVARGDAALKAKDFDTAAAAYELTLQRRPVHRAALQKLNRARIGQRDLDGAQRALEVATQVYPTLPWVWRDLARYQRKVGDFTESRDSWRRVLWCDLPEELLDETVKEALRGPGDAVAIAKQVLPERADVLARGARELEQAGEIEAAEATYRQATALDPRYGAWLARALLRWDRPEDAVAPARAAGEGCMALEVQGDALLRIQDYGGARTAYQKALAACRERPEQQRRFRIGVARARIGLGDRQGITSLESMLEEAPDPQLIRILVRDARQRGDRIRHALYLRRLAELEDLSKAEQRELERLDAGLPI